MLWEAGCCMLLPDFTQLVALAEQHCQAAGNGSSLVLQQQQQGKGASQQVPCIHVTADSRQQ